MSSEFKTFAVTGANGYVASQLIKTLLEKGFKVHTTVRSLKTLKTNSAHLLELDPKGEKIKFFEADLLQDGSFDEAFQGVDGVFHTASPFQMQVNDPEKDLLEPAVKGTENVLRSALKSDSVKRIVVTSSFAAVGGHYPGLNKLTFDESDWSDTPNLDPYSKSKYLAEKKAWEIIQDKKLNPRNVRLTVVNPTLVLGPPLSNRTDSTSIYLTIGILTNSFEHGIPRLAFGMNDVRDTADAHIYSMLDDHTEGRLICSSSRTYTLGDIAKQLKEKYPHVQTKEAEGEDLPQLTIKNDKVVKALGRPLRDLRQTLSDMAERLYELGLVPRGEESS